MDEIEALCDEIIILKKGKTIFKGTVGEVKNIKLFIWVLKNRFFIEEIGELRRHLRQEYVLDLINYV